MTATTELVDKRSKRVITVVFFLYVQEAQTSAFFFFFSVKGLTVSNLGFPGHRVSVTTVLVLSSAIVMQKEAINNVLMNGHDCVPVQHMYKTKLVS